MDSPAEASEGLPSVYNSHDSLFCFHFIDEETDPYIHSKHPLWWTKPGCREGKRVNVKRLGSTVAAGAALSSILKTVEDPDNVLSKKSKDRLLSKCADTFVPGVIYSMEKRNRWAEARPAILLDGVDTDEVSVQVVEEKAPLPANYWKYRTVTAIHKLDENGEMLSKTARGQGTSLSSLTSFPREKHQHQRKRQAQRGAAKEDEKNDNVKDNVPRKAEIRYTIMHEKPVYFGRYVRGKADLKYPLHHRTRRDYTAYIDESEPSELEQIEDSAYAEEIECGSRGNMKFSLADFITKEVKERPKGIRSSKLSLSFEKIELPDREVVKPFDLVDITSVPTGTFEFAKVNTTKWTNFTFVEQVEALSCKGYDVRWLDRNFRRVLIDATCVADRPVIGLSTEPTMVIVIEKCWEKDRSYLRIFLNTTYLTEEHFNYKLLKRSLTRHDVSNIENLVEGTLRFPQQWKIRNWKQEPSLSNEYLPVFNVKEFIASTHRIGHQHMMNMLREECVQMSDDLFEDLGLNGLESGSSLSNESHSIPSGVKCESCGSEQISTLYEMDDCWMCRECLAQSALRQIRTDCVPINLPVVTPPGIASYDVLLSILPLPLVNFYTKHTAVKLIKEAMDNLELSECPGCRQVVEILAPNEYNCAQCECGIVWCTRCKEEPHWPMTCDMAIEWKRRWKHQKLGYYRRSQRRGEIVCLCGKSIVFNESELEVQCMYCKIQFDTQSMRTVCARIRPRSHTLFFGEDTIPLNFYVPRIKKDVIEICEKARKSRLCPAEMCKLYKACRNVKDGDLNISSCRDIRLMALYIIEYGSAWVYMHKSLVGRVALKRNLNQIIRQYEELSAIDNDGPLFVKSIKSLKVLLQRTIDLIKHNL